MILLNQLKVLGLLVMGSAVFYAGCTERACFQWTAAEGACPSQPDALKFFEDPNCGAGEIESVDSNGEYEDDEVCCYDVTKRDDTYGYECVPVPDSGSSVVAVGVAASSSGGGFSGVGGAGQGGVSTGTGMGGAGGGGPCIGCLQALSGGNTSDLCAASLVLYQNLVDCQCMGACAMACGDNQCMGVLPSMECDACTQDSVNGCGVPQSECLSDSK